MKVVICALPVGGANARTCSTLLPHRPPACYLLPDHLPNGDSMPAPSLQDLLGLRLPPVALSFLPEPPPGVSRVASGAAAGCGYWRLAAEGSVFYTEAPD